MNTVMYHLITGICSEKSIVKQFHRCVTITECTYTNLHGGLYGTASGSQATNLYSRLPGHMDRLALHHHGKLFLKWQWHLKLAKVAVLVDLCPV